MIGRIILLASLLLACGGSPPPAAPAPDPKAGPADTAPAAAEPAAAETKPPESCDDACTEYAVCHEDVHGGDFTGGGQCVSDCEEKDDSGRAAYFACIASAADCEKMLGC